MIIEAPINSLEGAKIQIELGAKAVYLGYSTEKMKNMSLTGRGSYSVQGVKSNIENISEVEEIVNYAHSKDVKVLYTANVPSLAEPFGDMYLEHVRYGVEAGVDAIIAGDIVEIMLIKKYYNIPIIASTFLDTFNVGQIKFLEDLGVSAVVLPQHLKMEEIEEIRKNTKLELILFGNYGCSNNNGRCFLLHRLGENKDIGIPCRAEYCISCNKKEKATDTIMDQGEDCIICALPYLIESGIDSIKIIDRCKPAEEIAPYIKVCNDAIEHFKAGGTVEEFKKILFGYAPWWEEEFCENKRCRYIKSERTKNYS